jgi:hypothetical protein
MATVTLQPAVQEILLDKLQYLAGLWRETKAEEVIYRYQAVYVTLTELGFDEALDLESLLPDRHMPKEYFTRLERLKAAYYQAHPEAQPK